MAEPGSLPAPRPDRKTIEKNRRLLMKSLCAKLDSLLPSSKEGAPLHDRLEEAVRYIRGTQARLERMRERKTELAGGGEPSRGARRAAHIEVQDLSSGLRVVLLRCPSDGFSFHAAVRAVEEEAGDVVTANVAVLGGRALHSLHSMVRDPEHDVGAEKVLERLKKALHTF